MKSKILVVDSGHNLEQHGIALEILNRGESVFLPTSTQIQNRFDDIMARMPTLADVNASKHRKARIIRARAKRRKNKR